ncbi:MAG: DUF1801 domain-containing protein [Hyphomonadaceae bacterium]
MAKKVAKAPAKKAAAKKAASDWRSEIITRARALIKEAAPKAIEEAKWAKATNPAGVPTWSQDGIICTGETYKDKVKFTFARGATLDDPAGLFNAADTGATRRAIDMREGYKLNEKAFKALVKEAVALNSAKKKT